MDAEGVWYQLNANRPDFFKSWQAMALASTTMLESDILSTLYAYQAYYYLFSDQEAVNNGVLQNFTDSQ